MKIGFARIYTKNSDFKYNFENIKKFYFDAINKELEIVVFPRLALTGFSINNSFLNNDYLENMLSYFKKIIELTSGKNTKILIGGISYENDYYENGDIFKSTIKDSAFFIDNACIDSTIFRKEIDKNNILEDYKYFDKHDFLKFFEYKKKKFAVLLSDDIFSNFNIILVSDNKPNYIICIDSSNRKNIEKQLIKLAKFSGAPVFYMNSTNYSDGDLFNGRIILINEDFHIIMNNLYNRDEIIDFEIDCEDGTELFLKNNFEQNQSIIPVLKKYFGRKNVTLDIDKYQNYSFDKKQCRLVTFSNKNINDMIEKIDIEKYINKELYHKLNSKEKDIIKNRIIDIL